MSSRFIHVSAWVRIPFLFKAEWYCITLHISFILACIAGHSCHLLDTVTDAAMNMGVNFCHLQPLLFWSLYDRDQVCILTKQLLNFKKHNVMHSCKGILHRGSGDVYIHIQTSWVHGKLLDLFYFYFRKKSGFDPLNSRYIPFINWYPQFKKLYNNKSDLSPGTWRKKSVSNSHCPWMNYSLGGRCGCDVQ